MVLQIHCNAKPSLSPPLTSPTALLSDEDNVAVESLATAMDSEMNLSSSSSVDIHLADHDSLLAATSSLGQIFHRRREHDAARVGTLQHALATAVTAPLASVNITGRQASTPKIQGNIYLTLMDVLVITIGKVVVAAPEVEWRKVQHVQLTAVINAGFDSGQRGTVTSAE
ncbi:hypothetical protein Cni_G11387 [Canna indica]|uniref:Uncharacterized protein n=1 Tax=Canna indica TaxID=4628 RepID=A0AAQ3QB71_9LILI|nr:hypothetical protein Cni_G11387 [Canna indica]